jgi:hypothetical protein
MSRIPAAMRMNPAMRGDGATSPRSPASGTGDPPGGSSGFGGMRVFSFTLKVPPFGGRKLGSPYRLGFYGHFGGPWLKEGNIELKSSLNLCRLGARHVTLCRREEAYARADHAPGRCENEEGEP